MFDDLDFQIIFDEWDYLLTEKAKKFGINFDYHQMLKMKIHALEMLKWNKITNLTSIIDPSEIAIKHFLDSSISTLFINKNARILDIGSGAGFPGIPIKLILPSTNVTLIDSSRKKISFLKHIIRILNLNCIFAVQTRFQDMYNIEKYKKSFDVVICRAFTKLNDFIKIAIPFLSKKGIIIALKGKVNRFNNSIDDTNINEKFIFNDRTFFITNYSYYLPIVNLDRNIIIVK